MPTSARNYTPERYEDIWHLKSSGGAYQYDVFVHLSPKQLFVLLHGDKEERVQADVGRYFRDGYEYRKLTHFSCSEHYKLKHFTCSEYRKLTYFSCSQYCKVKHFSCSEYCKLIYSIVHFPWSDVDCFFWKAGGAPPPHPFHTLLTPSLKMLHQLLGLLGLAQSKISKSQSSLHNEQGCQQLP